MPGVGNGSGERGEHAEAAGEVRSRDLVHLVAGPQTEARPVGGPGNVHVGDAVHRAVVEWEHAVALGLLEPQVHQLPQLRRLPFREIDLLRGIDAGVEQRPLVGREVVAADEQVALGRGQLVDVVGHGLPSVGVDRPASPALEVLARPRTRPPPRRRPPSRRLVPSNDICAMPSSSSGSGTPQRSSTVGSTSIAWQYWSRNPPRSDARPREDHRAAHAAFVRVALPTPERRVRRERPAPWVVTARAEATEIVEVGEAVRRRRRSSSEM